ncbi:MAG: hypothetical protein WCA35_31490, partial [Kovacikia sp.]
SNFSSAFCSILSARCCLRSAPKPLDFFAIMPIQPHSIHDYLNPLDSHPQLKLRWDLIVPTFSRRTAYPNRSKLRGIGSRFKIISEFDKKSIGGAH